MRIGRSLGGVDTGGAGGRPEVVAATKLEVENVWGVDGGRLVCSVSWFVLSLWFISRLRFKNSFPFFLRQKQFLVGLPAIKLPGWRPEAESESEREVRAASMIFFSPCVVCLYMKSLSFKSFME